MSKLSELLKKVNVEEISEEYGYDTLKDGYYLCEVEEIELTESQKGDDMIKWVMKTVEDGITFDEEGKKVYISKTAGKKVYNFHVIKDENGLNRALSDLLKFEESEGVPLLDKAYFESDEALETSLELIIGRRIFIHLETSKNKTTGESSQWKRFVSWKGIRALELE